MNVPELSLACADAIQHPERSLPDKPLITLVGRGSLFPRKGWPRPKRLLSEKSNGERVWHYDAMSVLVALVANDLVEEKFLERVKKDVGGVVAGEREQ